MIKRDKGGGKYWAMNGSLNPIAELKKLKGEKLEILL